MVFYIVCFLWEHNRDQGPRVNNNRAKGSLKPSSPRPIYILNVPPPTPVSPKCCLPIPPLFGLSHLSRGDRVRKRGEGQDCNARGDNMSSWKSFLAVLWIRDILVRYYFCLMIEGSGSYLVLADPGGPETYGSESATLLSRVFFGSPRWPLLTSPNRTCSSREYLIINRRPGFLAEVCIGSSPALSSPRCLSFSDFLLVAGRAYLRGGGGGVGVPNYFKTWSTINN